MKKIFSLFVASVMAMSLFAGELTVDLSRAEGYTHAVDGSGAVQFADGVLTVNWAVGTGWEVAGTEIALDSLTGVTNLNLEFKGDGNNVTLLVYLRDSEGNRWWDSNNGSSSLSASEWTPMAMVPAASLWDGPSYNFGDKPFVKLGLIANPATPTNGTFDLRNVKITCDYEPVVPAKPETAPAAPAHAEEDVMALYCNHYTTNNLHFTPQSWSGIAWETLSLDGTDVAYTAAMTWDGFMGATDSVDLSGYSKLHFDIWAPDTLMIDLTFEAKAGFKHGIQFKLNAGWNTIDADPAWWNYEEITYDWKNVKCIIFEHYMHRDSTSAEGSPLAVANVYFWNEPTPDYPEAPALPTMDENGVMALFSPAYQVNTVNFQAQDWGNGWDDIDGKFYYSPAMTWGGFANWAQESYNMNAYDMFACDIWVEQESSLKITFEAAPAGKWKNGSMYALEANKWNHVEVDLLNEPYSTYEFDDLKCLILEGYTHEGTPMGVANAYFFNSAYQAVEHVEAGKTAVKRLIDGKLVIEKNGVRYNAQGTRF